MKIKKRILGKDSDGNMFGSNSIQNISSPSNAGLSPVRKYRIGKPSLPTSPDKAFRKKVNFSPLKKILAPSGQIVKTSPVGNALPFNPNNS